MATAAQSDIPVPAIQLLQQCGGHPVLLYEEGQTVAAIVSMEDYAIVHQEKVARMFETFDALHREIESSGGVDDETMAEILAESD